MPNRFTKIVATLGPASFEPEVLEQLIAAGLNVARVNGSHGTHEGHAQTIANVRKCSEKLKKTVGILFDLQGPKIRIGTFEGEPLQVKAGDELRLAVGRSPENGELPSDYALLDQDVEAGQPLLIDDGTIECEVVQVQQGLVRCKVLNDGAIQERKGINLPKSNVSAPAITEKDRKDALFAAEQGVDFIALSFVRRGEDVAALKKLLKDAGHDIPIIAKIEKPQALDHLEEILKESWGCMVARGDLGVELNPEEVPIAQKNIIRMANRLGKPVITATQMLDSMTRNPRPTRAEASDVANAVLDGTDAVMLSGETATGRYPVRTVEMMTRIIRATESGRELMPQARRRERGVNSIADAVADATTQVAHNLEAKVIATYSRTGTTAILVSMRRPRRQQICVTPDPIASARLSLVWGVSPYCFPRANSIDERVKMLDKLTMDNGYVNAGDIMVLCMATPNAKAGSTNIVLVHRAGDEDHPQ